MLYINLSRLYHIYDVYHYIYIIERISMSYCYLSDKITIN